MNKNLVPSLFSSNFGWPSLFNDNDWVESLTENSGLSVYEDTKNVTVEASVPGVPTEKIEVTFNQGMLWIHGAIEEKEDDKKRKYYHHSSSSFSYRFMVPGDVDTAKEPTVTHKNGIVKVSFSKVPSVEPKRLPIKSE